MDLLAMVLSLVCFAPEINSIYDYSYSRSGLPIRRPNSLTRVACTRYNLTNGKAKYRHRGRFIKFTCNLGFELYGDRAAPCSLGHWDISVKPMCVRNSCKPITNAPTGLINYPTHSGAVLNFFCTSGYKVLGNPRIMCDGKAWQGKLPICIAQNSKPALFCDFESENICGWTHDVDHDFDWRRMRYSTPSGSINTGPSFDHTKGSGKDGYYMYIESSARNPNDTARLISPVFTKTSNSTCFEFYYHMYGSTVGVLKVYLKKMSEKWDLKGSTVLFEKSGNQGDHWYRHYNFLEPIKEDYQIVIEGIRGHSYVSDIAIDDVRVIENCEPEEDISTSTTEVSTEMEPSAPVLESCENRCGLKHQVTAQYLSLMCDCDDDCYSENRCCPDFLDHCLGSTVEDSTTTTEAIAFTTILLTTKKVAPSTSTTTTTTTTTVKPTARKTTTTTTVKPTVRKTTTTTTTTTTAKPRTIIFLKPDTTTTARTTQESYNDDKYLTNNNKDYSLEESFEEIGDKDVFWPYQQSVSEKKVLADNKHETKPNYLLITSICVVLCCCTILVAVLAKKYKFYKCKNRQIQQGSSNSQSDVRFLTCDEALDFSVSGYDEL